MTDGRDGKGRFACGNHLNLVPFQPGNPGRPTSYRAEYDQIARKFFLMAKAGTDEDLADLLDTDVATLRKWKKKFPSFSAAIKQGKHHSDLEVAESTYFKATGGSVIVKEIVNVPVWDAAAKRVLKMPQVMETTKYIEGDSRAQHLWLMNRQGKHWRSGFALSDQPPPAGSQQPTVNVNITLQAEREQIEAIMARAIEVARASVSEPPEAPKPGLNGKANGHGR
jgi:hypothetical protein